MHSAAIILRTRAHGVLVPPGTEFAARTRTRQNNHHLIRSAFRKPHAHRARGRAVHGASVRSRVPESPHRVDSDVRDVIGRRNGGAREPARFVGHVTHAAPRPVTAMRSYATGVG
jgi:hypothetical protein